MVLAPSLALPRFALPLAHESVAGVERRYRPPFFPASLSLAPPSLLFYGGEGGRGDSGGPS